MGDTTLVIKRAKVRGRNVTINKPLKVTDPNKSEVTTIYFATKEIKSIDEKDGTHKYTFKSKSVNNTKTKAQKNNIAGIIRNSVNKTIKAQNKKVRSLDDITSKMTKDSYTKGDIILFDIYKTKQKKETSYKKIANASMGNQMYLIVETKELEGKKVKIKIHENEKELKLLKTKDELLPVLVYAKLDDKTATEASDWISIDIKKEKGKKTGGKIVLAEGSDTIEVGIKKIQMRPKKDKMASKTEEASKSFEGWAEKLYIREDESTDGKKSEKQKAEEVRTKETFVTLTKDDTATKVSYPKKISGSSSIEVGKIAVYNLDEYKYKQKTGREDDKKNIQWSLHIKGDKTSKYTVINTKSKANLYTYAKMEIVGGKNKLTIVFDKALKGKKIQIEPYRNKPDIDQSKKAGGFDYIKSTKIKEKPTSKVVRKENTKLWLQTECDECTIKEKEFLKGNYFKLKALSWHEPVDNPMLCLYTQNGNYRPRYNSFGKVRIERTKKPTHQGIDLLALPGSNIYACIDGTIVRAGSSGGGYGNIITIKADNPNEVKNRKRVFVLQYKSKGELTQGKNFNENGDFYVFYAHLSKVDVKIGEKVIAGQIIGENGTSGYGKSKDPHLHFEILNAKKASGLNNRVHPGFYCYYKQEKEMTQEDKDYHKKIAQKFWD